MNWWREARRNIFVYGVPVAIVVGTIIYAFNAAIDYFETRPLTVSLQPVSGETSIAPFFELQIRPEFNKVCARPNWLRWIGETVFDEHCVRLIFAPHTLERMVTRRVPYKETAEPDELLRLFLRHHRGCLDLAEEDGMLTISEPENSQLVREGDKVICP